MRVQVLYGCEKGAAVAVGRSASFSVFVSGALAKFRFFASLAPVRLSAPAAGVFPVMNKSSTDHLGREDQRED